MMRARPNPFQKMQEDREENSGAFFDEIEVYTKRYKANCYAVTKQHGLVAAHKMDFIRPLADR